MPGVRLPTEAVVTVGMMVAELVTNACKHAYRPDEPGCVYVRFERVADGRCRLTVGDNGAGLPGDFEPRSSRGLGMMMVQAQAEQLVGELEIDRAPPGVRFVTTFPVP